MAYVQPDAVAFKARYPEFAPVSDVLVGLVLAEAFSEVGDSWVETDRARAQMLLTAHKLAMEGEPGRTTTGQGFALTGAVKRERIGDVETEFNGLPNGATEAGGSAAWYRATSYGSQYYTLMRQNFPPIAAV